MTYRSEDAALEAELSQLEGELSAAREKVERLRDVVDVRRAFARWRRLLGPALGLFALGALSAGFAYAAKKRGETQFTQEKRRLEERIQYFESRLDQLKRVRQIAEAGKPLIRVLGGFGTPDDRELFEAIRNADPRKPDDAWWIVAHGECRAYPKNGLDEHTVPHLSAERRERAQAFCARAKEGE